MTPQSQFSRALLDPEQPVPDGLAGPNGRAAGRRFDVYRNNVVLGLSDALADCFPVIAKLLGADAFAAVARRYVRQHPPETPLMMFYGDAFPAFLAGIEQLGHLGYLADTARLELALRRAYHAADRPALAADRLQALPPEDLMAAKLVFVPALQIVRSDWPIHAIWRFNTEPDAEQPRMAAQDVLITRPGFDPVPVVLPSQAAALLAALMAGVPFGTALEQAPGVDLAAVLGLLLAQGAIADIIKGDSL